MYELLIAYFLENTLKDQPKVKDLKKQFPDVTAEDITAAWPEYLKQKDVKATELEEANKLVEGSSSVTFEKPFRYAHGGVTVVTYSGDVEECPAEVVNSANAIGGYIAKEEE